MIQLTLSETAKIYNCSEDQLKRQYVKNIAQIKKMYFKALETGKKVRGFSSSQLSEILINYNSKI